MVKSLLKFIYATAFNKKLPLSVGIQITNRCNQRCIYCNYPSNLDPAELAFTEWVKIIVNMKKAGVKAVTFSGGEPMLKEGIIDLLRISKKNGLYVLLSTNGYLVKENVDGLKLVDNIGISLDGEEYIHDRIRGKGTYRIALDAIIACRKKGLNVSHGMVVNRLNLGQVDYILRFTREHKTYAAFQILQYNPEGNTVSKNWKKNKDIDELCLDTREIRNVFGYLAARKKEGYPIINSYKYLKIIAEWDYFPMTYTDEYMRGINCSAGEHYCFIYPDGHVFACNMFHRQDVKIKDGDFYTSFKQLERNKNCRCCLIPCHLERNLLFSLDPNSIKTWFYTVFPDIQYF